MKQIFTIFLLLASLTLFAQSPNDQFKTVKEVKTSPVKNQYRSGTCWSFATLSFLESEILRETGEEYDLSEMFIVYHAYMQKAERYYRLHGKTVFGPGGQAHDVINVWKEFGLMPEDAYAGLNYGTEKHIHSEMDAMLKAVMKTVVSNKNKKLSSAWIKAYEGVLSAYLGELPESFSYAGKDFKASDYGTSLKVKPEDYVELTSYSHHPFYTQFSLEIPDNWSFDNYYNVKIDELMEVMEYAIDNGYSIAWDGDVSEETFSHRKGKAVLEDETQTVDQGVRQKAFDNFSSTDDHLMHITGIAKDTEGNEYFITKNSWGAKSNDFGGYLYMSKNYVRMNTVAILVHKDAIPKNLKKKLGL